MSEERIVATAMRLARMMGCEFVQRGVPKKHPELRGDRLDAHCPYDETTLRQDMTYPDRAICPVCFTSMLKPPAPATSA